MDINLGAMNGIECVERLTAEIPTMQILMLTVYEDTDQIFKALAAARRERNASVKTRSSPAETAPGDPVEVHDGGSPMSSSIARKVVASFQKSKQPDEKKSHLSPRSVNGFEMPGPGTDLQTNCRSVEISIDTIRTYLRRGLRKTARPVAHRSGGQISESLVLRGQWERHGLFRRG